MLLPASKLLKVVKGVTFDYPFQYFIGTPQNFTIQNLTGWHGAWIITWESPGSGGQTTLTTGNSPGESGVFFGGPTDDPTTGRIDLVIVPTDTAMIPWTIATYILNLTDPLNNEYQLLAGGIGVVP